MKKADAVIIGGGIIGLSCAVELAKSGAKVTLIEKGEIGMGCSYGNAGWMTPCFAMPLPLPGLFFQSLKWLANPESPLYIKPSPSLLLAKWLWLFMRAMNEKQAHAAIEALVNLSKVSLAEYEKISQEFPEMGFEKKGLLMVSQTTAGVRAALEEMNLVSGYGVPGRLMSGEEIKDFEPSLRGPLQGGVYFPDEAHAEPLKVVQALGKKARALGVQILEKTHFLQAGLENQSIRSITVRSESTAQSGQVGGKIQEIVGDQFVLATGS